MSGTELLKSYFAGIPDTQEEVAARFGVSQAYVALLLSGDRVVKRLDIADRIERATDGAVPASSWLHAVSKRPSAENRKAPARGRVVRRSTGRRSGEPSHRRS